MLGFKLCVASSTLILIPPGCGRFGTHGVSFLSELCWKEVFAEARLHPPPRFGLELYYDLPQNFWAA